MKNLPLTGLKSEKQPEKQTLSSVIAPIRAAHKYSYDNNITVSVSPVFFFFCNTLNTMTPMTANRRTTAATAPTMTPMGRESEENDQIINEPDSVRNLYGWNISEDTEFVTNATD